MHPTVMKVHRPETDDDVGGRRRDTVRSAPPVDASDRGSYGRCLRD